MKKIFIYSAMTLICSVHANPPALHQGSKSVAEIKRDLAYLNPKPVQPEKVVALPMPNVKLDIPSAGMIRSFIQENNQPQNENQLSEAQKSSPEKNEKTTEKMVADLPQPSVATIKNFIQTQPTNLENQSGKNPSPKLPKVEQPSVATIKNFIQEQPQIAEKPPVNLPDLKPSSSLPAVTAIKHFIQDQAAKEKEIPASPLSVSRHKIIASGKKLIGTPYLFGGTTRSGFDCSGLVQYVYKQHGISVPRTSRNQFASLKYVKDPQPGDLVFFRHGNRPVNHVGIYVGDNKMLHAPSTGKRVKIVDISTKYWKRRYAGARRVTNLAHLN